MDVRISSRQWLWFIPLVVLGTAGWFISAAARSLVPQDDVRPQAQIDRLSLEEMNLDFVRLAVYASVMSKNSVDIREVVLENLKLNGVSVYAVPFIGPWKVPANVPAALPKPLSVKIYLRDLDSTEPLEQLLSTSRIVAEGSARVKLSLNVLQQLLLRSRSATASFPFRTEVPFSLPAPSPVLDIAAMIVRIGSPILGGARAGLDAAREAASTWRRDLRANYLPLVVHLRTTYRIRNANGDKLPVTFECNGVRISENGFIAPLEAVEPWTFDPEVAAAIKGKSVSIVRDASEVEAVTASIPGRAFKLSAGDLRLVRKGSVETDTIIVPGESGGTVKVAVARRQSASNVAYFEFADAARGDAKQTFAFADASAAVRLATFRWSEGNKSSPELVFLDAAVKDDFINLVDPIDSAAAGAPLVSTAGIVGFVSDENHGIRIQQALKKLKLERVLKDRTR